MPSSSSSSSKQGQSSKQPQRFSFYQPTTSFVTEINNNSGTSSSNNMGKDDEDLNDLLKEVRNDQGIELAPLTGDGSVKNGSGGDGAAAKSSSQSASYGNFTLLELLFAYVSYTCDYAPKLCWTVGIILLLVPAYLLIMGVLANPTEHFGEIKHDFSTIQSVYDFKLKDIDHWCLKGDDNSCRCEDPLQPAPRAEFRAWGKAHGGNVDMIGKLEEADMLSPDIAFLGGSVVEKMDGKWFGGESDQRLRDVARAWAKHFTSVDNEASTADAPTAVALGIAGDTVRVHVHDWHCKVVVLLFISFTRSLYHVH
jgi:hypothetical protein